jgi:hypothetical protein
MLINENVPESWHLANGEEAGEMKQWRKWLGNQRSGISA